MKANSGRDLEVFIEAMQLPMEGRIAFLDQACAGDNGLFRRVDALLKCNDRAADFLEQAPALTIAEWKDKAPVGEKPGDRIDRYVLLQQIGEGGCGVVFVAEQNVPVSRRVAL